MFGLPEKDPVQELMPFACPEFHAFGCVQGTNYIAHNQLSVMSCLGVYESKNLVRGKFENRGHHLLSRKNGIHTVAIVMPNHLKKCSGGISVIPNTDCSALDMSRK
jgi:hypothetical protein